MREFTEEIASEISNYDIEEVHLDFIRYPFRSFGFNPIALAEYKLTLKGLSNGTDSFDRFRIDMTRQVSMISEKQFRARAKSYPAQSMMIIRREPYMSVFNPGLSGWKTALLMRQLSWHMAKSQEEVISRVKNIRSLHGSLNNIRIGLGGTLCLQMG